MTRELMQEFLLQLFEETGRTHFFVTSEIEEAIFLADRLVVLSNRPVTVREVIDNRAAATARVPHAEHGRRPTTTSARRSKSFTRRR